MPTVILLDVSLSMSRPVINQDNTDSLTRYQLAVHGINAFLDSLSVYSKLEFISLIAFSSLYEVVSGFTRDYEIIKNKLHTLEEFDKTCIETALHAVNSLVLEEWGNNVPCQVILITDGSLGVGPMSLKHSLMTANKRDLNNPFALPFPFPGELHVVSVMAPDDPNLFLARSSYQKLVDFAGNNGSVIMPENNLSVNSITSMFKKFAEDIYSFKGVLKCGNLSSNIVLSPPPMPHTKVSDFDSKRMMLSKTIEVVGFINAADVSSPMAISRHLVLPVGGFSKDNQFADPQINIKQESGESHSEGEDGNNDEGKIPSFCVLLHGALKVENVVALVLVGEEWYGYIYSHADCKKKSNLMLTVLSPGSDVVPWLGDLNNLGTVDFLDPGEQPASFPVRPNDKRSYSQNCVVWIRQVGLQSDIQKILRHARKLPDKTQQFYKELNRLRRAAISLGFMELLDGLAYIFERECSLLPGGTNPDCALQLTHAANEIRKTHNRDMKFVITPLITQFNSNSSGKNF